MLLFFQAAQQVADSLQVAADKLDQAIAQADGLDKLALVTQQLIDSGIQAGGHILKAVIVFLVGRFLIRMLNRLVRRLMDKRNVDISIKTFVRSLVNILLTVLLIVSVVGALGVETTSFAALLASAGVAVGMALSGNLQNFAGGLVILLFKPYKVGDWIDAQNVSGTVKEIQIFHTILTTADNKLIYVPNGALSSGVVTNYSNQTTRRVEWIVGVDYGEDYNKVEKVVREVLAADKRILDDPAPFIALHALDASSVNVVARVWVNSADYWGVYFDINKAIYATFNEQGINFPFLNSQFIRHPTDNSYKKGGYFIGGNHPFSRFIFNRLTHSKIFCRIIRVVCDA